MKKLVFIILFSLSLVAFSQEENKQTTEIDYEPTTKNIIKTNITSIAFRNYEFQYERIFNKTISVNLNYGFIPKGKIPMLNSIKSRIDDDDTFKLLEKAEMKQSNFIAECRFYLGKGYGKGFYLAPFYDHSKYTIEGYDFEFTDDTNTKQTVVASGDIKGNTFGLLIGTQFDLGSNIVLDWWILGAHYGVSKGNLSAHSTRPLSASEQQSLRDEIDGIDIPMVKIESKVSANDAEGVIDGPWAGLRGGVSIGYRF